MPVAHVFEGFMVCLGRHFYLATAVFVVPCEPVEGCADGEGSAQGCVLVNSNHRLMQEQSNHICLLPGVMKMRLVHDQKQKRKGAKRIRAVPAAQVEVARLLVGAYMTSFDMAGFSLSLLLLDDARTAALDAPTQVLLNRQQSAPIGHAHAGADSS